MTFFFQVVGCTIDKAEAESLCAEDKRMGEAFSLVFCGLKEFVSLHLQVFGDLHQAPFGTTP